MIADRSETVRKEAAVPKKPGSALPPGQINLRKPYLILLGDVTDPLVAKTAFGLRDWIPNEVVGQWRFHPSTIDLGLADMDAVQAAAAGAGSLVIGAAPSGGQLPPHWREALLGAAQAGLDVVSGLHGSLEEVDDLAATARRAGVRLHEIRRAPARLPIGSGVRRSGKRLLTVGADCAIGKKYTALALTRAMQRKGFDTTFRATGQTGILIAGAGIAIDTVVADFLSGAAEMLSPPAAPDHWDVIEGQGSLFHPSYAGVSLALLHGSQPDALVVCTDARRREIDGCPGFPLPTVGDAIRLNVELARRVNRNARCVGISMNTSMLSADEAEARMGKVSEEHGVPCVDPMRDGVDRIVSVLDPLR